MGTEVLLQAQPIGATRSLTEVFILLRNNAMQSRHIFSEASAVTTSGKRMFSEVSEDRLSLIPLEDGVYSSNMHNRMPPEWVNIVDEIQYELLRVQTRIRELKELQLQLVSRPNFSDEKSQEERSIEASTSDITKMLAHCQKLVQLVQSNGGGANRDSSLRRNVTTSLMQCLQNITLEFKSNQTHYLNQLKNRVDSCEKFFNQFDVEHSATTDLLPTFWDNEFSTSSFSPDVLPEEPKGEMTMKQLQSLHENTTIAQDRAREIRNILKSFVEINQLFKDLAGFIVDQGTVLDRIDYNVEQTNVKVKSALRSVKKAEEYQRKNRKMWCIMVLSATIIILLLLLIIRKA